MTDAFRIDCQWLQRDWGTPPERNGYADVTISADDVVLTRLYDQLAQTRRDSARLSVVHMARWFIANWWRLRWEPHRPGAEWRLSHCLAAAGGGFLWPGLEFACDGEFMSVVARNRVQPIKAMAQYETDGVVMVSARAFEQTIDGLLDALIARLSTLGTPDVDLEGLWREVLAERASPGDASFRKREALLGLDPDEVDEKVLRQTFLAGEWLGQGALAEVLAASTVADLSPRLSSLAKCRDTSTASQIDISAVLHVGFTEQKGVEPWERGESLAQQLRAAAGFGDRPLLAELDNFVGQKISRLSPFVATGAGEFSVAIRHDASETKLTPFLLDGWETSRRFHVARMLGDVASAGTGDHAIPVTSRATSRQKVQRAFATEFLLPTTVLRQRLTLPEPHPHEIEALAEEYGVSPLTVQSKLVNRGLVARDCFRNV